MKMHRLTRIEVGAAIVFLTPSLAGFALFYLIPFGQSILISFQGRLDNKGMTLDNYRDLFLSSSFQKAAANTFWFTAVSVPLLIILSLALALLLNRRVFARKWLRSAYVLPLVVPAASIVMAWQIIFDWNGTANSLLEHLGKGRLDWMKSEWAFLVVVLIYTWKYMGYSILLFLAGIQNIPEQYYEIANLEGAGPVRKLQITLTYLTPTTLLAVLMSVLNSFKIFRETYLLTGDYPYDRIYMMQHYMNNMFLSLDIYKLSATAAAMAACILLLVAILFRVEQTFSSFME